MGQYCDLSEQDALRLVTSVNIQLETISTFTALNNTVINDLKEYQSIVASKPEYVTNELTSKINELVKSQIELMMTGKIDTNPNLINLLDFSLDLTS